MCTIPFLKLERILTLLIVMAKGLELMNFLYIIHLSIFGSKMLLTVKIMDFENVVLSKIHIYIHIYIYDKGHECIIYMI
jgi:hypothetical protein